jgi:hypothetical protein
VNAMKYKVAVAVLVVLCAIVIGDGYRITRRTEQNKHTLHTAVAELSIQQLAASIKECDTPRDQHKPPIHDAAYCEEISRRLDTQPLQIVEAPEPKGPL